MQPSEPERMFYCRNNIAEIEGYTPGEQPQNRDLIKLNTNENPYPPSPAVCDALADVDPADLRLYPNPFAEPVQKEAARVYGVETGQVLCGNGSDDLLTMAVRTFVDQGGALACFEPTYSLYPVLAGIQGAVCRHIPLDGDFDLPRIDTVLEYARDCSLFFVCRPNSPAGNVFDRERVREICEKFHGIVWIDEAYADFAGDNCLNLVAEYDNVVVSRSLSKSYSLAGLRLGVAVGRPEQISQMIKVKDSYNVDMLTQRIGAAALEDQQHMRGNAERIKATRERLSRRLVGLGWQVVPSEANFVFAAPPAGAAYTMDFLRRNDVLVRHFPGTRTGDYLRITIGSDQEIDTLLMHLERLEK